MVGTMHKWAAFLAALFFCGSVLADQRVLEQSGVHVFPGSSIAMRDGDIILNTSASILGALNSQYGFPRGRYSHAMVYVKGADAAGVLLNYEDDGLEERQDFKLNLSNELALIRPRRAPPPDALIAAMKQLKARPLQFDYELRWPSLESNTTYCAGFISQLYRMAGLPDPFPPNGVDEVTERYMERWAMENLGFDIKQTVSPNKILTSTDYELVAVYIPEDIKSSVPRIIARTVTRKMQGYIEHDHMQPTPPGAGSQLLISMANLGMMDKNILAMMPEKRRKPLAHLFEFFSVVKARVERHLRLHNDVAWKEQDVEEITAVVADQYRDRFFTKSATH